MFHVTVVVQDCDCQVSQSECLHPISLLYNINALEVQIESFIVINFFLRYCVFVLLLAKFVQKKL